MNMNVNPPKADLDTAIAFLKALRPKGPWNLTAITPDGPVTSATFTDAAKARAWMEKRAGKANLHYVPNPAPKPTGKAGRAHKGDVPVFEFLHADIDVDKADSLGDISLARRKDMVRDQLDALTPPTLLVDSGGGLQALWRLAEPLPATPENIEKVEGANRWLAGQYPGGEPQCANVDHLLRLPGTINHPDARKRKRGRTIVPTRLLSSNGDAYASDEFGHVVAPAKAKVDIEFGAPEECDVEALGLDERTLTIVMDGRLPESKEGDDSRSAWLFDGVCNLVRHGVVPEQILWILLGQEFGISESVLDPDKHSSPADQLAYAERQVRNALAIVKAERDAEFGEVDPEWLEDEPTGEDGPFDWGAWFEKNWTPIGQCDIASIPPTRWVCEGILLENEVSTLGGKGGSGKSLFAWGMVAMIASGKPFLWFEPPPTPLRVLVISGEDDVPEIERRVSAACQAMGIDRAELGDRFMAWGERTIRLATKDIKTGKTALTKLGRGVRWAIENRDVRVVVVDPVIKGSTGFKESENDDMEEFYSILRSLTDGHPCAILTVDHFQKGGSGGDQASIRGASAKVDASRVAATISGMTESEYKDLKPPRPREQYALFTDPKQNYSKKSGGRWMELVDFEVGNGEVRPSLIWRDLASAEGFYDPKRWLNRQQFLRMIDDGREGDDGKYVPWQASSKGRREARLNVAVSQRFDITEKQAEGWLAAFENEGSIIKVKWKTPQRNEIDVWALNPDFQTEEDTEAETIRDA
ncbi:MAG: AAA family ATPase [Mesorhizobium sp.]|nr:AAA family ATPase [Mesorhizobium sp.]MBL8577725.1 AAA family ATPase [Mesorhizobium sp.]